METVKLVKYLSEYVTPERLALFETVLEHRTRFITVVLEDIYQPHNASAVLRSMDCFGVQDAHIIENSNEYRVNPDVALGASKWLNLIKYNQSEDNTRSAIHSLRSKNYRIVATTPHKKEVELPDFRIEDGKIALLFGTEMRGLSQIAQDMADEFLSIPMYGFTESFNISVSAAIILYHLKEKLKKSTVDWKLTEEEKQHIKLEWLKGSIKRSDLIIKKFLSDSRNH
ncbi:MAG: TrmH family RNA methyltransferase [Bacteroidales bacterium]